VVEKAGLTLGKFIWEGKQILLTIHWNSPGSRN